ncbi:hypothetical protein T484DRAFT_1979464 [Baffinella frigidus]|nr:hypothetical protein T484DRAFT_1979464 [Cryptophyta sp. CCMP2293]
MRTGLALLGVSRSPAAKVRDIAPPFSRRSSSRRRKSSSRIPWRGSGPARPNVTTRSATACRWREGCPSQRRPSMAIRSILVRFSSPSEQTEALRAPRRRESAMQSASPSEAPAVPDLPRGFLERSVVLQCIALRETPATSLPRMAAAVESRSPWEAVRFVFA